MCGSMVTLECHYTCHILWLTTKRLTRHGTIGSPWTRTSDLNSEEDDQAVRVVASGYVIRTAMSSYE